MKRRILPFTVPLEQCTTGCLLCHPLVGRAPLQRPSLTAEVIQSGLEAAVAAGEPPRELAIYGSPLRLGLEALEQLLQPVAQSSAGSLEGGVRLAMRPDQVTADGLERLKAVGLRTVELDVPSLSLRVLSRMGAGHQLESVVEAVRQVRQAGLQLGLVLQPGLPGSSYSEDLATGRRVVQLRPDFVRLHPALVMRGTWLEACVQQGDFLPMSVEEAAGLCRALLEIFDQAQIPVVRIGLQPQRDLEIEPNAVVGGPYHPSLRHLIESQRMYERAEQVLGTRLSPGAGVRLHVTPAQESPLRGPENINLERLRRRFRLDSIVVVQNIQLGRDTLQAEWLPPTGTLVRSPQVEASSE